MSRDFILDPDRRQTSFIFTGSCAWYGISVQPECCSSGPSCQKLHVRLHSQMKYLTMIGACFLFVVTILLDSRLNKKHVLKISDFGLSRDVQDKDYYKTKDTSIELPVRWMSPESLTKSIFTTRSDVVSTTAVFQVGYAMKIQHLSVSPLPFTV